MRVISNTVWPSTITTPTDADITTKRTTAALKRFAPAIYLEKIFEDNSYYCKIYLVMIKHNLTT
jgi:hypothetical protein